MFHCFVVLVMVNQHHKNRKDVINYD